MTNDQELILKVKAETDKATKEISRLTKEVDKLTKTNEKLGKQTKGVKDLNKSYAGLAKSVKSLAGAYGALKIAQGALDLSKQAAKAQQSADAFDKVFTDMGASAEEEFAKIKEASKGLLSEADIKQSAVTAASLGVPINKLSELMEVARAKSKEMGTDAKSAFADLATGIGRGSPMILDNLGLTIKLGEANKAYADKLGKSVEELTKQEKQIALTNAVIEAGSASVKRYANESLNATEKTQKLDAKIKDLSNKLGNALTPVVEKGVDYLLKFANAIDEVNKSMKERDVGGGGGGGSWGETTDAVKKATEAVQKYSKEQEKALEKSYSKRLKDAESSNKKLESNEKKLVNDLVKLWNDYNNKIKSIDNARFNTHQSVLQQIGELERSNMDDKAAYYDSQKDAEKALSDAKIALKAGEYEKYKTFIEQYKSLVTDSAGQEIKLNEQVAVSKEETTRRGIEGLKTYDQMMGQFYEKQKADAAAAYEASAKQKIAELEGTQAVIEAQKVQIELAKRLIEVLTGKKVDIDTSGITAALENVSGRVDQLKQNLVNIQETPVTANINSQPIDAAKQKVEELKTLTLNGVTLEVDAKTKVADFDIKKFINKYDKEGNLISIEVNPEYKKAEKELDAFRNGEKKDDVTIPVDANTAKAEGKINKLKKPTKSEHTVSDNVPKVLSDIDKLKVTTYSDHYIREHVVPARAGGGAIPQRLASGGTFRGSGRVPGYDPTDSDKVNALLTGGEHVTKRIATQFYGKRMMDDINAMRFPKLPGYAEGGSVGGAGSSSSSPALTPINLNIGDNSFGVMGDREVAEALQRFINSEGGL